MRRVSTAVLPDPAPATISSGRTLVQHGLALLRVEPVEQLIGLGGAIVISALELTARPGTPTAEPRRQLCADAALGGTLDRVLNQHGRFFYGYRPAVPVV